MSNINNGGPAFPCDNIVERDSLGRLDGYEISSSGMTLRDYFAAHAPAQSTDFGSDVAAALVGRPMPEWKAYMDGNKESEIAYAIDRVKFHIDLQAALRGMYADAMLKARMEC